VAVKSVEIQQSLRIVELKEASARLRAELPLPILKWLRLNVMSELSPPTIMASTKILKICGFHML
jgi:hypothetical protein